MSVEIKVITNGFEGDHLILDDNVTPQNSHWDSQSHPITSKSFAVSTKRCRFHIRGGIGASSFLFKLDDDDKIIPTSIQPPNAAKLATSDNDRRTLKLRTQEVSIHPSNYPGYYLTNLKSHPTAKKIEMGTTGSLKAHAVNDLAFTVWNGCSRGGGVIYSIVCTDGCVCVTNPDTGVGGDHTLTLRTSKITVLPGNETIKVSGYPDKIVDTEGKGVEVIVIRGLRAEADYGAADPRPAIVFRPYEPV